MFECGSFVGSKYCDPADEPRLSLSAAGIKVKDTRVLKLESHNFYYI
jgi:hypothetical protein